jgi:hypothetical protein
MPNVATVAIAPSNNATRMDNLVEILRLEKMEILRGVCDEQFMSRALQARFKPDEDASEPRSLQL